MLVKSISDELMPLEGLSKKKFEDMEPHELNFVINQLAKLVEIRRDLIILANTKMQAGKTPEEFIGKYDTVPSRKLLDVDIKGVSIQQYLRR